MKRDRTGGVLLLILGILTVGTSAYFLFFRPPLLPEDIRFTGADPLLLDPRMATWIGIVFRTWGGFMTGFGLLICAVGGSLLSGRQGVLRWGAAAAVLVAFGRFLVSNVEIRSDFKPFVAILFAIAIATAARLLIGRHRMDGVD
jgi:hypothetical protein